MARRLKKPRLAANVRYPIGDLVRLPNLVSLARLPLAAAFPFCVSWPPVALAVLGIAGGTDVLDGWLARRRGETTAMGALIDPLADKLFVTVVVVTLVLEQLIPAWVVVLLATREIGQIGLFVWTLLRSSRSGAPKTRRRVNLPSKLTTAFQFASVATVLAIGSWVAPLFVLTALLGMSAAVAYWFVELQSNAGRC
jgi:cardiolipin synthase (CMP-forming)